MKNFKLNLNIAPKQRTSTGEKYYTVMGVTASEYVFIGADGKTGSMPISKNLPAFASGEEVIVDDAGYIIEHNATRLVKAETHATTNSRRGGSKLIGFSTM